MAIDLEMADIAAMILKKAKQLVDVKAVDRNGRSAVSLAADKGYEAVGEILIRHKDMDIEAINARDDVGHRALYYAIMGKDKPKILA